MRLIWALDHGLQSLSKKMQARLGLTGPQRVTLRILGRYPALTAGELAEILRIHPSTLTGILQRLEARGLVRRTSDARDRRRTRLALTPRGRRRDVPERGTVEAVLGRVLRRFPRSRVRAAAAVLAALGDGLAEAVP
jgi:DNA-binding MarR family transcriptional regulator